MNTNAFAKIVAAILRVCSPSSCLSSSLILWMRPGCDAAMSSRSPAASLTPLTKWSAALSMTSGGTVADCVRIERSAVLARIQPDCGHREYVFGESPVKIATSRSSTLSSSLASVAPLLVRSCAGSRTATDDRIARPLDLICSPSLEMASTSTVAAGITSVSMTTGETLGSVTRMSGRFAPCFKMPMFSELTTPSCDHARRVVRRTAARASLIVCSVIGIRSDPPQ